MISIIVLFIVFVLIAVRQIGSIKFQIWQAMLFGAVTVLSTRQISLQSAFNSINFDVIFFLLGMFVVGQALEESGYLSHLAYNFFEKAKSVDSLILFVLFGMGFASAFLMNDTIAIIGTPAVLLLAKSHKLPSKLLLLSLAFAVTIGSVFSPIGNPQNLLIALNGNIGNSFVVFSGFLLIPTIINLFLAFILLKFFFRKDFHSNFLVHFEEPIKDKKLAFLSKISLILVIFLVFAKILVVFSGIQINFRLTYIALISALPILVFSKKRYGIIKRVDWHTLVFFASMFVLMESVWLTGFFQSIINDLNLNITSVPVILFVSVILSQLISNVPLVALYLPMLTHAGVASKELLMALAAGSTIAGNMLILGAASNVIIIHNAERKSGETLTFLEFARIGIPLTVINVLVYWIFLAVI
jgi:Na+/H+ antiporter NhaD/arsenite permease-like protein